MPETVTRALLRIYRRLPVRARRRIVRSISPNFTVGAMCFVERHDAGLRIELVGEPAVVVDPAPQRVDLIFRARLSNGTALEPVPGSPEIRSARWFPSDALPELQHETAQAMVALARSWHSPQARPLHPLGPRESYAS
jgi:8-oxo-dGTP diphosphatase